MGGQYDEHGPHGPEVPDTGAVLEGEIVLPEPRERGRGRSQHNRKGNEYGRIMDEDLVRDVIEARTVKGWTLMKVAETFGVAHETVRRWCGQADQVGRAVSATNVLKVRQEIAESLAVVSKEAWKIHEETTDRKIKLDALARIESVDRTRALLHGANAPVRHDVTIAAVTEAERELQEIINEARAKQANDEATVIKAASEDPDL